MIGRGPRRKAAVIVLSLSCGAAAMGCRQVLDVDGYGEAPARPGKCDGVTYRSYECRDCVEQGECCDVAEACSEDPACRALSQCLARCERDDHDCRALCTLSIPGTPAMDALIACEASSCSMCPASRSVRGGAACDACVADICPGEIDALSRSVDALSRDACQRDCVGAPGCTEACQSQASPAPELEPVAACESKCSSACDPAAADWSCLDTVEWPPAASKKLELNLQLVYVQNSDKALQQFDVTAVGEFDDTQFATASATTATDGWALLKVHQPDFAQPNFFGHLVVTSKEPGLGAPGLLYFFPPIRRSPSYVTRRYVSKDLAVLTAASLGVPLDWDHRGGIVWSAQSCNGPHAPGLVVSTDTNDAAFYYSDSLHYDPDADATSDRGIGVMMNVPPGTRRMTATLKSSGRLVGTYDVLVQAGSITHVTLAPKPRQ